MAEKLTEVKAGHLTLTKEHGIHMVKLLIEASKYGGYQQVLSFLEDNLLFESLIELGEVEDFLTVILKISASN